MRALFEDLAFTSAHTGAVVGRVTLPLTAARRDLWIRLRAAGVDLALKAYATRAEAQTTTPPSSYLASATVASGSLSATEQSVTMADNAGTPPTMTGLTIVGTFASVPSGAGTVWAYTAAPDLVVADNLRTLLLTRAAPGCALAQLATDADPAATGSVVVGHPGRTMPDRFVSIVPQPPTFGEGAGNMWEIGYPIDINAHVAMLDSPEAAWRACREVMAAVQSMFLDEHRRSYGECYLEYVQSQGPAAVDGADNWFMGTVTVKAVFETVWRDDSL